MKQEHVTSENKRQLWHQKNVLFLLFKHLQRPFMYRIAVLLLVALASCRTDYTAETNATTSLLGVLSKVEAASAQIDARLLRQYVKDVSEKCKKIQSELTDTIELDQAQHLVDFCALQNHFKSCLSRKEHIDAQLLQTRNQLEHLHLDLQQRRANKDSVNVYIEQEFLFVESLNHATQQTVTELNECFKTYTELKEEIDRLLIALPKREIP